MSVWRRGGGVISGGRGPAVEEYVVLSGEFVTLHRIRLKVKPMSAVRYVTARHTVLMSAPPAPDPDRSVRRHRDGQFVLAGSDDGTHQRSRPIGSPIRSPIGIFVPIRIFVRR